MKFAAFAKRSSSVALAGMALTWAGTALSQQTPSGSPLDQTQTTTSSTTSNNSSDAAQAVAATLGGNPYASSQTFSPLNVNGQNSAATTAQPVLGKASSDGGDNALKAPATPGEFETYVEHLFGRKIPLFGTKLVLPALRDFAAPATATVPADYIVQPGDTIDIALAGSLDGSVSRDVDTNGQVFLTGVGSVHVAGIRNSDLHEVIERAIGTKFRGFTVGVTVTKLRGIRVYVTGLANNPGAFTVSSLSTLANAVFQAGGPNSGGSWRGIKLYRSGHQIADFDLYQLMRGGSQVNDVQLQNEDVLFIPPAGPQVAVVGSVGEEGIFEARPGESVSAMLAAAGGVNTLGDPSRFALYRSGDANQIGPQQIAMNSASATPIEPGDIIQVLSTGTLTMPIDNQKILVRVEGEVQTPGIYYVTPGTKTSDIIARAGGLSPRAYPYGTRFTRESERIQQLESFNEALNQLEISLAAAPLSQDPTLAAGDRASQQAAARAVVERLRQAKPDGRLVLDISPDATSVPDDIALENNDRIYVPKLATTVGVFGAVYRPASFFLDARHSRMRVSAYIDEAGGPLRVADKGGIFVVHANGEVISKKRGALKAYVLPGDVIFVPVRTQPNLFWARFHDIANMFFGAGLTAATIVAVTR